MLKAWYVGFHAQGVDILVENENAEDRRPLIGFYTHAVVLAEHGEEAQAKGLKACQEAWQSNEASVLDQSVNGPQWTIDRVFRAKLSHFVWQRMRGRGPASRGVIFYPADLVG